MRERICLAEGCDRTGKLTRGFCARCYMRWLRHGDPLVQKQAYIRGSAKQRFLAKVNKTDGCWFWTADLDQHGHARFTWPGGKLAHRFAYEMFVGPIPEGLVLDHLCHTADRSCPGGTACPHRRCVNPAHLEPVTSFVNTLRGISPQAVNAAKNQCANGHSFDEANTYIRPNGARDCRACIRQRTAAYKIRKCGAS